MKKLAEYVMTRLVSGLLIVAPIYLAILLLLKAMKAVAGLVKPVAHLVPAWLPADQLLSLLLVLVCCFLIGLAVRTKAGRAAWERGENSLFQRLPGYALIRSLTQRLAENTGTRHGHRHLPKSKRPWCRHSSLKNLMMAA